MSSTGQAREQRGILIVGLGKRIREALLPALERCRAQWRVDGIFARSAREETVGARSHSVRTLEDLCQADLDAAELVYLAVGKQAVPRALTQLSSLDLSGTDLLIDTPVVRFKNFRHATRLRRFRQAWVPEDCAYLPWFDVLREAAGEGGPLGEPRKLHFERAAYAYHALASAKALLGAGRVGSGRRIRSGGVERRAVEFIARGSEPPPGAVAAAQAGARRSLTWVLPRDYATGWFRLEGSQGQVSDAPEHNPGALQLLARVEQGHLRGFRLGDLSSELDDDEAALTAGAEAGQSVIALQEAMKRVGLLRLLRDVHAGRGAYPVLDGLDDMVVDYHLEKFGRYRANPFTSARSGLARGLLSTLSRLARG